MKKDILLCRIQANEPKFHFLYSFRYKVIVKIILETLLKWTAKEFSNHNELPPFYGDPSFFGNTCLELNYDLWVPLACKTIFS